MNHRVTSYIGQRKDHSGLQGVPRRGSSASIPSNISGVLIPPPPPASRKDSKTKKHTAVSLSSLFYILNKQHDICRIVAISRCFHMWRRETILLVESMKTRSERTAALMLGGVDDDNLDHMELTRAKSTKIGISLMKWMINSKHTNTLRHAWGLWKDAVC